MKSFIPYKVEENIMQVGQIIYNNIISYIILDVSRTTDL